MADTDQAAVTVELELADSSLGPDGSYQSVIQVRISSTKRQACEMVETGNPARNPGSVGR
jgi:hypothetical protein